MNGTGEVEILRARSQVYRLLALSFLSPEEPTAAEVATGNFDGALAQAVARLDPVTADRLTPPLRQLQASLSDFDFDRWQGEYARVFGHTLPRDCPPYESQYGTAHVFMQSQELADIAAFYRAFGLEVQANERLDHVAVELEFMGFLYFKLSCALRLGHSEDRVALVSEAQQGFLRDHLGRWAPAFCRLLRKSAGGGWYAALAGFLLEFLRTEMDGHGISARTVTEATPGPVDTNLEPDCLSCPLAASAEG